MWFPTVEEVIAFHDELIEETGGEPGVMYRGDIEAAISRTRGEVVDQDDDLFRRAAFLVRGIAQDHPFVDGNKRTAFETMDVFLRRNGWEVDAPADEVVEFTVAVARGLTIGEIRAWIADHSGKL